MKLLSTFATALLLVLPVLGQTPPAKPANPVTKPQQPFADLRNTRVYSFSELRTERAKLGGQNVLVRLEGGKFKNPSRLTDGTAFYTYENARLCLEKEVEKDIVEELKAQPTTVLVVLHVSAEGGENWARIKSLNEDKQELPSPDTTKIWELAELEKETKFLEGKIVRLRFDASRAQEPMRSGDNYYTYLRYDGGPGSRNTEHFIIPHAGYEAMRRVMRSGRKRSLVYIRCRGMRFEMVGLEWNEEKKEYTW